MTQTDLSVFKCTIAQVDTEKREGANLRCRPQVETA
jgi:hypothetical protein